MESTSNVKFIITKPEFDLNLGATSSGAENADKTNWETNDHSNMVDSTPNANYYRNVVSLTNGSFKTRPTLEELQVNLKFL